MFYPRDHQIYDESFDMIPAAAVLKGQPEQRQDIFGFWLVDTVQLAGEDIVEQTFVYRMRQVLADKLTGSGEEIVAGDRVYAVVAQAHAITANPAGTAGVDYYFCGWAKFDADAADTQVIINFDGTRYDEDV
jgi:hypothetical protein